MASVYSLVEALPPKSPVIVLPSAIVWKTRSEKAAQSQESPYRQSGVFDLVSVVKQVHVSVAMDQHQVLGRGLLAYLNIMRDERSNAVGLAKPLPIKDEITMLKM